MASVSFVCEIRDPSNRGTHKFSVYLGVVCVFLKTPTCLLLTLCAWQVTPRHRAEQTTPRLEVIFHCWKMKERERERENVRNYSDLKLCFNFFNITSNEIAVRACWETGSFTRKFKIKILHLSVYTAVISQLYSILRYFIILKKSQKSPEYRFFGILENSQKSRNSGIPFFSRH